MVQIATAFPCDRLGLSCRVVMASMLEEDEKLQVVASMVADVREWNTDFRVSQPPDGTVVVSNDLVSDAWIRLMAVLPSVQEDGKLLSPGYGEVVAKSNFEVRKPYKTERRDCKTTYDLDYASRIQQYLNGKRIGTGEIASFETAAKVLNFQADLVISTELKVKHYRWKRIDRKWKCIYDNTEIRKGTTIASDNLRVLRHQPNITYSFKVENKYYGITQIKFNASNHSWFRLQFNNKDYYEERLTEFERFFTLEPYYILNFRPYAQKTVKHEGIRYYNNTFQVTNTAGCKILLGEYFRTYTIPCPQDYTSTDLRITTNKDTYTPGEPILVSITPAIPTQLTYSNTTITAQSTATFTAQLHESLISAKANGVETFHSIHVTNPKVWTIAVGIIGFLLVAYLFWKIITKILGEAYGLWNP